MQPASTRAEVLTLNYGPVCEGKGKSEGRGRLISLSMRGPVPRQQRRPLQEAVPAGIGQGDGLVHIYDASLITALSPRWTTTAAPSPSSSPL